MTRPATLFDRARRRHAVVDLRPEGVRHRSRPVAPLRDRPAAPALTPTPAGYVPVASGEQEAWVATAPLIRLDNPIRDYPWGSHTAIATLQGRPTPSPGPEAELWIGAHPTAPSRRQPDGAPLTEVIAADPDAWLGPEGVAAHGRELPFLLKVLAAAEPLSLQAHPSAEQAAAGFAAEEAAGIPLDAPHRIYRDPCPKPELLCALTPVDALCAFRPVPDTLDLLDALDVDALVEVAAQLRDDGDDALPAAVRTLLTLPADHARTLVDEVAAGARNVADAGGRFAAEAGCAATLAEHHPGDPGVAVALFLHLVRLRPGEAIHLPAGNLHAYLRGTGVEIMASSDNVLRGGLTAKHVDVDGLLEVLDATPADPPVVAPEPGVPGETVYPTPAPQFRLSVLHLDDQHPVTLDRRGVQILLCTEGEAAVTADGAAETLTGGDSVLVTGAAREVELTGAGKVFRATAGDHR